MRKLRGFIPTTALLVSIVLGATVANAGIIINSKTGLDGSDPCKEETGLDAGSLINALTGIIINSKTGIIINSKDGIIINSKTLAGDENDTCGIIINS